ncbi:centaurin-gamma-1A isoform X2 [Schistocerca gregaria]|uniref:centaurin-gamma-1A isoform X2 n=1 Tax=Schistocerca gregaria TaxID=7010 RepID=UPI00211DF2B4|nr:centaurin-gamma-1A isoform X2 [Schistocerca gregaria]
MQEESPEGGRFKKEVLCDGGSYLLLIRDEGGPPEMQFSAWVDAVIFVFSLENEASFNAIYTYYTKMAHFRNSADIPLILVGTQDAISESNPRVIDDARARKLAADLKRCSYYETCATYGLNVERVFQDACQKIVAQRLAAAVPAPAPAPPPAAPGGGSRPPTPSGAPHFAVPQAPAPTVQRPSSQHQLQQQQQASPTNNGSSCTLLGGSQPSLVAASAASAAAAASPSHASTLSHKVGRPGRTSPPRAAPLASAQRADPLLLPQEAASVAGSLRQVHTLSSAGKHRAAAAAPAPAAQQDSNRQLEAAPHDNNNVKALDNLQPPAQGRDKDLPTPSSTPTTSRKSRRRSNLFTPSKKGEDKLKNGTELGSGRAIPLKQGYLYKRSSKALNKEWKKKYVTLCDDGRLTYHPSLHDYMDDVHGKEISLQYVTVKVPGQKPRGSKSIVSASAGANNGINESLGSLTITSFQGKERRTADKVLLTAFELRSDPGSRLIQSSTNEDAVILSNNAISQSLLNGTDMKIETPNVKKRHRRMKSSGMKNTECDDSDGYEFFIVSLDNKQWHFEASNSEERDEWVMAIEQQILNSLQANESLKTKFYGADAASLEAIRTRVPGNSHCVDCDYPNPDWASVNLGVLMCIECSGVHRNLGSHISRVRSLHLDEWTPGQLSVMLAMGNATANGLWEASLHPGRAKPTPNSSREEKERWIRSKYEHKEFLAAAPAGAPLAQQLVDAVCRSDIKTLALLLAHATPDQVNATVSARDLRTPLHLACATRNLAVAQLLVWNNANVRAVDHEGRTCLAYAAGSEDIELVELLASCAWQAPGSGT